MKKAAQLDRRIIYVLVLVALAVPLLLGVAVKPARMTSAEKVYDTIEKLDNSKKQIVLLAIDFGPNSMAENLPQAEIIIEHLMRRRIPFATYSQYALAQPFLGSVPETVAARLTKENNSESWIYGKDWVNLGVKLGSPRIQIQALADSESIPQFLKKDAKGNALADLPAFQGIQTLRDIPVFVQLTSLTNTFESYVQFLKREDFRPIFLHGCTSISIPKAYIYMDSGQLSGLLEGVAGAAWYSVLLKEKFPNRANDSSLLINTGLGVAHLVIVALIIWGNIAALLAIRNSKVKET